MGGRLINRTLLLTAGNVGANPTPPASSKETMKKKIMTFTVGDIIFTAVASIVGTVATWYLCAALLGAFHGYIQQTAIEAVASSRVVDQLIQDSSRQSSRTAEALVVEGISKHESRYEHKERPQSKAKHYRIYDNCAGRCIELNDNVIEGQR